MPDSLYETDALAWAERQAELLRCLARGERLNETIDWENVIEEVQDVGLSELRACESLLEQAVLHILKLYLEPESPSASHWKTEIVGFLRTARKRFAPSMRQRIDLREIFEDMVFQIRVGANGERDPRLPACCPFTLDDLLDPRPDVMALAARLEPARLGPLAPHEEAEHGG